MNMKPNPLARSIVAMLIWRRRVAHQRWMHYEKSVQPYENYANVLYAEFREANNAAEYARRLLYGEDL